MKRSDALELIKSESAPWDVLIIGGGSTGLGCALDAVSRGYRTLLIEQGDFANATSSRSTKLIHGGVRYLKQGNISLVRESLAERGWLLRRLPHLVRPQPFLIPTYSFWETWYYRIGLWMYDRLAGTLRINSSIRCNRKQALERVPTLKPDELSGGIVYWDGQFDDARLCVDIVRTIWAEGGLALNYLKAENLIKKDGKVVGIEAADCQTGSRFEIHSESIIQATGIFSDEIRKRDSPDSKPMIRSSRGSHVVVDKSFLPNGNAIMIPKTSDGRLLFFVPWYDKVIVGTTDISDDNICLEPHPSNEEIEFILANAAPYLTKPIGRKDVSSVWTGLRPLVMKSTKEGNTASLSRNHVIEVGESGLITIAGGKWTTFRKMGEDAIDKAITVGGLDKRPSRSKTMRFKTFDEEFVDEGPFAKYGSGAGVLQSWIQEAPELGERIHPRLEYCWAELLWSIREELAESVEDVLARRTRSLFLDAQAAIEVAPKVGDFLAKELGRDTEWAEHSVESFIRIAKNYDISSYS